MKFTTKELELVYDALDDKFSNTINGDWKAVRSDLADLHLLQGKVLKQIVTMEKSEITKEDLEDLKIDKSKPIKIVKEESK